MSSTDQTPDQLEAIFMVLEEIRDTLQAFRADLNELTTQVRGPAAIDKPHLALRTTGSTR